MGDKTVDGCVPITIGVIGMIHQNQIPALVHDPVPHSIGLKGRRNNERSEAKAQVIARKISNFARRKRKESKSEQISAVVICCTF